MFTANGEIQSTPTIERNALYTSDSGGSVWRLNARTGSVVWQTSLSTVTGDGGSYSRVSPAIGSYEVVVGDQASGTLIGLSKATGKLLWQTVVASNQGAIITSSPIVVNGRIYVGVSSRQEYLTSVVPNFVLDFRGSVVALDAASGQVLWQTYTVPVGYTGGAVWSSTVAVDPMRQALYVTTGNNYSVPNEVATCQAAATTPAELDECLPVGDHIDSIMSLDLGSGAVKWAQRFTHADTWTVSCFPSSQPPAAPCPTPTGEDTDFGAGANLFSIKHGGIRRDVVGAGQKSGAYFTLDRDSGQILWGTQVGPGGPDGGVLWGTATDGRRIYVPSANSANVETHLVPSGVTTNGGFWSALEPSTGEILWQTPTFSPAPFFPPAEAPLAEAEGSVTVANNVVYGEDSAGNFVGMDAKTGTIILTLQSGGASIAGPAVVDGTLYWPSGYAAIGATNNKLYAFWLGPH